MRLFRYTLIALALTVVVALLLTSSGCQFTRKVIGKDKLNQGVIAYNAGNFGEALQLFKSATEYISDQPVVWLYYGAALRKTYQAKGSGQEWMETVNQALDAYNKALELAGNDCKTKDNAIGYIATIYDDLMANTEGEDKIKYENAHREWLLKRAENECATNDVKVVTYYSIAVKYWTCAYNQSTRYSDKTKAFDPFHCRNFYYEPDKKKFEDCLVKGFEYIDKALAINPDYADALSYKSLLFRERQKATCAEAERKKFEAEAKKLADRAIELMKQQKAIEEAAKAQAPQG